MNIPLMVIFCYGRTVYVLICTVSTIKLTLYSVRVVNDYADTVVGHWVSVVNTYADNFFPQIFANIFA